MNNRLRYWAPYDMGPAHAGDAGLDLRAHEETLIPSQSFAFVHTGVRIAIPDGKFAWVVARSSTFGRHGLLILPGIIDCGYTGEVGVAAFNASTWPCSLGIGERVAQLVLLNNEWANYDLDRQDSPDQVHPVKTTRGTNGFGSTGR